MKRNGNGWATDTIYGFNRVSNYNFSLGLSTKLYGMYKPLFMKKKEIQIRHVVTPQISISGAPAFVNIGMEHEDKDGIYILFLSLFQSAIRYGTT